MFKEYYSLDFGMKMIFECDKKLVF